MALNKDFKVKDTINVGVSGVFGNGIRIGTSGKYVSTTGAAVDAWGPILSGGRDIGQFFGDGVDTVRETVLAGGSVTGDGTLTIEALAQKAGYQSTFGTPKIGTEDQAWDSVPGSGVTVTIPDLSSDADAAPYQGTLQIQTQEDASGIVDSNGEWVSNGKFSLVEVLGLQGYDSPLFTGLTLSGDGFGNNSVATLSASNELIIDPRNDGDILGKVRIKGDFYVDGTTTTINSTSVSLSDSVIALGYGENNFLDSDAKVPAGGVGIQAGSIANATILYTGSNGWVIDGNELTSQVNFNVGTSSEDKFSVISSSGNVSTKGTLHVDGGTTIDNNLTLSGVFTVKSDGAAGVPQFTVTQAGVTNVSGSLAVAKGTDDEALIVNSSTGEVTMFSATVEDLTDNRIVIVGANKELEDDAKFRFDGSSFDIGAADSETFSVAVDTGNTNVSGALTLGGAFTMEGSDGDERATIDTSGNLTVDGNTTLSGDFRITTDDGTDKFTVAQSSGATNVSGAVLLGNSFTMEDPSTGKEVAKIDTSGNLTIDGIATLSGDLVVKTDADVEMFSVDQDTGNVALSGTLQVKGDSDLDGKLTVQDSLKIAQSVGSTHYTLTDVFAGTSGADGTAATPITTFAIANLNTAKYIVTIGTGGNKTAIEVLAVTNGSNDVAGTAYGQVEIGTDQLVDLEVGAASGNVTISVSGLTNGTEVTVQGTAHYNS